MLKVRGPVRSVLLCAAIAASACQQTPVTHSDVVLNGYSAENYVLLDALLGKHACITGEVFAGTSVFFQLEPIEREGILNFGYSRVMVQWRSIRSYGRVKRGSTYRICGELRDTTDRQHCDTQDCREYELRDAVLS